MARKLAFVIHNFVRTDDGLALSLSLTICFGQLLAHKIARADSADVEGVAVYEIDLDNSDDGPIRPVIVHGDIPEHYRKLECHRLLAGTRAAAEYAPA